MIFVYLLIGFVILFGITNYLQAIVRVKEKTGTCSYGLKLSLKTLITVLYLYPCGVLLGMSVVLINNPVAILGEMHYGWVIAIYSVVILAIIILGITLIWQQITYEYTNYFMSNITHRVVLSFIVLAIALISMIIGLSTVDGKTIIIKEAKHINIVNNIPNAENLNFVLETDIDCNIAGDSWYGSIENYYGEFDGNYHSIKNLDFSSTQPGNFGLFKNNKGVIKNLRIEDSYVRIYGERYSNGIEVSSYGLLCGVNYGEIDNCSVKDTFIHKATGYRGGVTYVGGLVGINENGKITCCEFVNEKTADRNKWGNKIFNYSIYVDAQSSIMGNPSSCFYVGGICGQTINGEISNCLTGPSTMHIYMQFSLGKPLLSTGGLIGKADGNYIINNSVSLAECSNSKESTPGYNINNYCGVFISTAGDNGTITNSYAKPSSSAWIIGNKSEGLSGVTELISSDIQVNDLGGNYISWSKTDKWYPSPCKGFDGQDVQES